MIIAQSAALSIGFILDLIFGDPDFALHPIRLMGKLISLLEKAFRKVFPKTPGGEKTAGAFEAVLVVVICGGISAAILFFAYRYHVVLGAAVESVMCYFMLSVKSLAKAGNSVYKPLIKGNIEEARRNVSMIVGRDTNRLDDIGITKAAVETIAENTSDGAAAPMFYMALGGGVLGCIYKAVNTMDSMLGYKNDKYINFGRFAAKLDDAVNYIPSRIAAALMIVSSFLLGFDSRNALRIYRRDSRAHASPNSAQTESAAAGALRVQLAGDAYYFGELYKKPFIGDPIKDIQYFDIKNANKLMYMTSFLMFLLCVGIKTAAVIAIGRLM